jgi:hypothetical protein
MPCPAGADTYDIAECADLGRLYLNRFKRERFETRRAAHSACHSPSVLSAATALNTTASRGRCGLSVRASALL